MFEEKPEVVAVTKIYVNGKFVSETSKVISPGPDWIRLIFLAIAIPAGFLVMIAQGVFNPYG
jgi:hypothetical protein